MRKKGKNFCAPCMLALNPPKVNLGWLVALGLGVYFAQKLLGKGMAGLGDTFVGGPDGVPAAPITPSNMPVDVSTIPGFIPNTPAASAPALSEPTPLNAPPTAQQTAQQIAWHEIWMRRKKARAEKQRRKRAYRSNQTFEDKVKRMQRHAARMKKRAERKARRGGVAAFEDTIVEDFAAEAESTPVYASEYAQPMQMPQPQGVQFGAFSEGQKHELVMSGLQQGLLSIATCSKKRIDPNQSRYRNCRFVTSEGSAVNFDAASNFVFGRRY